MYPISKHNDPPFVDEEEFWIPFFDNLKKIQQTSIDRLLMIPWLDYDVIG